MLTITLKLSYLDGDSPSHVCSLWVDDALFCLTQFIEPSYSGLCSWLAHDNRKGRTFISENQILADSTVFPLLFFLKYNSDENLFPVNRIVISEE